MRVVTLEEHISLPQFDNRISKEARMARGCPDSDSNASPINHITHVYRDAGLARSVEEVLKSQVWITTSGLFT